MLAAVAVGSPRAHVQLSGSPSTPRSGRRSLLCITNAASQATAIGAASEQRLLAKESSNIVPATGLDVGLSEAQRRKLELQAAAQAALEAENSWWQDDSSTPSNLVTASTPAEYKRLISGAPPSQLVVVDYLKPSCAACRRLFPKLQQIAASNPDALFVKVNVETPEMRELGRGMQVTHLPWFHLFRGGDMVASFSANITTVANLRAEIATNKLCTDPGCTVF